MGSQSAVLIFIFSCPPLCLIKSEWLWSFPLGFFPSCASLCDLIRCMIHAARSLGFHRKCGHVVRCAPTAPGQRPHMGEVCTCVCTLCFVLRHISSYIIHARRWVQRESSVVLRWTAFIRTYMYPWFSWLHSHLPLSVMCVINRLNPLSWLHLQAAGVWASAWDCGSELACKLNDQADTQPSCDKDK